MLNAMDLFCIPHNAAYGNDTIQFIKTRINNSNDLILSILININFEFVIYFIVIIYLFFFIYRLY